MWKPRTRKIEGTHEAARQPMEMYATMSEREMKPSGEVTDERVLRLHLAKEDISRR